MSKRIKTTNIPLPAEQVKALDAIAKLQSSTSEKIVNSLVREYINEHIPLLVDELERVKNHDGGGNNGE